MCFEFSGLKSCGINCEYLIGQGYDGASYMNGKYKGVQGIVRAKYPKAIYVHCAVHTLNLAVTKPSNIQAIRNCLSIIEKLNDFFNTPKRNSVLLNCIENANETLNAKSLKRLRVGYKAIMMLSMILLNRFHIGHMS